MEAMRGLFDAGNTPLLRRALSAYALRHRVIAENLANVDTQGYRAQDVSFETLLAEQDRDLVRGMRTHAGHLPIGGGNRNADPVILPSETPFDNGVNNVNVEEQSVLEAQNQLMWNMATRLLGKRYQGLRSAIKGQIQ
jgi:flagellar basal-body rod protein FlgB